MVTDEKRIINKGTDLLGHNTHREGHSRLTEPAPQIKINRNKPCISLGLTMIIAFKKHTTGLPIDRESQVCRLKLNTTNLALIRICHE